MTTEVLRNMLYADSDLLTNLSFVVMDEVHYLADRFRGAVWEEVIIHLDQEVRLVSLSATVSNAEEFGDWLQAVRGETAVIVSEERPVPLDQHVLVRGKLLDLFASTAAGSTASTPASTRNRVQLAGQPGAGPARDAAGGRGRHSAARPADRLPGPRSRGLRRGSTGPHLVRLLESTEPAAGDLLHLQPRRMRQGRRATCCTPECASPAPANATRSAPSSRNAAAPCATRTSRCSATGSGSRDWNAASPPTTPGCCPAFKEVVEELFQRKLVRAVFATETLALGINMPARTVVLEKLEKFNGEARVPITPGEYTQLTGRAGPARHRLPRPLGDPVAVGPRPGGGGVARLPAHLSAELELHADLQHGRQPDRAVRPGPHQGRSWSRRSRSSRPTARWSSLARKVRSQEESLDGYAKSMTCHLGDFTEYAALRRELTDLERKGARDAQSRADRERRGHQLNALRKRVKQHPCNACKDRETHARWAERWWRLKKQTDELTRQIRERTGLIAKIFDRVSDVLLELGYLAHRDGTLVVGPHGRTLRRIYGERDLLVAECLRRGTWKQLDVAGDRGHGLRAGLRAAARGRCADLPPPAEQDRSGRRSRRPPTCGAASTTWSASTGCREANRCPRRCACRCTSGRRAGRWMRCCATPSWPPATSCASPSRRSTCSIRSPWSAMAPSDRRHTPRWTPCGAASSRTRV